MTDTLTSKAISLLRFPLICAVVCIHTNLRVDCPWLEQLPFFSCFMHIFIDIICSIAVPVFFFISGLLFFREGTFSMSLYVKKIRSRIKTILIPYIAWTFIYLIVIVLLQWWHPNFRLLIHKSVYDLSFSDFLFLFWDMRQANDIPTDQAEPLVGQFWFLQCLMVLVLLSPIIYQGIKYLGVWFVVLVALLDVSGLMPFYPGVVFYTYFFFTLGAFFSLQDININGLLKNIRLWIYPLLIVVWVLAEAFPTNYLVLFIAKLLLLAAVVDVALCLVHRHIEMPALLVSATFFIFASHRFLTAIVTNVAKNGIVPVNSELSATAFYLLSTVLVVVLCVGTYVVMKRFLPKTTSFLVGKRL